LAVLDPRSFYVVRFKRCQEMHMNELAQLREEVLRANLGIYRAGLVTMHSGNASGIDRESGIVLIKPSGVDYERLTPSLLVATDLSGRELETGEPGDDLNASVDLPHHLYLYSNCQDIGGIVHTHSNYATSFAVLSRPIPAYLTAIADEFGAEVPCVPYVDNIGDHIGEAIVKHRRAECPAILLANHGAFTFGPTPQAALKAAVMLEDIAKTCHLATLLGAPTPLPPEEVRKWYDRYHTTYGQQPPSKAEASS
jgi:L-ribulose-5-phosphate 4-epimerase